MRTATILAALVMLGAQAPAENVTPDRPGEYLSPKAAEMVKSGYFLLPRASGRTHVCGEFYPPDGPAIRPKAGPMVRYRITTEGEVRDVEIVTSSGNAALDKAAIVCVKSWTYRPAEWHGKPIELESMNNVGWTVSEPVKPEPVNVITTQSRAPSPPPISSPASIGRPHVCLAAYPEEALETRQQGRTSLGFTITDQGRVADVKVLTSSGSVALDEASVTCAKAWRYKPAIQNNVPIAVPWKAEITWSITVDDKNLPLAIDGKHVCTKYPKAALKAREQGAVDVSFVVGADGTVKNVEVRQSSGSKSIDNATVKCVSAWRYKPAEEDGKPIDKPWRTKVTWTLPD